jgi:hypothetical protein
MAKTSPDAVERLALAKKKAAAAMAKKSGKPKSPSSITMKWGFDGMQGQPKNPKLQGD